MVRITLSCKMNRIVYSVCIFACVHSLLYEQKECKTSRKGAEYMGTVRTTANGRECQRWDEQQPHQHEFTNPLKFPDRDFNTSNNYCRNPDLDALPWCYTTDPEVRYEFCDIPVCDVYNNCAPNKEADYFGSKSTTASGITCNMWTDMSALQLSYVGSSVKAFNLDSNFCKNPDSKPGGPWCYTGAGLDDWEYCTISLCKPSATCTTTAQGTEYVGKRGITVSDRACQRWDRQFPHNHNFTDAEMFPDNNVTEAENFCRNPDNSEGVWCYTTDPDVVREYCDISACTGCKHTIDGKGYAGIEAVSSSGQSCQTWSSHQFDDPDLFPDVSVEDASNYCRNPDGKRDGVWCFIGDFDEQWEYCDVPLCEEDCERDALVKRTLKHILHFGVDGLHATCWQNASSGVPNLLRLTAQSAYTYSARAELETESSPNWAAHLCGMGVEETGIYWNDWRAVWMGNPWPITPVTGLNYPLPCVFYYLKGIDANIRTAAFPNWVWFYELTGRGSPGSTDVDYFCEVDYPAGLPCDWELVTNVSEYIQIVTETAERSYTLVSIDEIDSAGHTHGWCSEGYLAAVDELDAMLGVLLDALDGQDVLFVVGSDHGGDSDGHGQYTNADLLVPMWFSGPGVKAGYEIQSQIRNRDIVPTIVWAMGLKGSPYWNGDVIYEVFE